MLPYWLEPFFTFFPAYAWFFLGIGIPWAFALLPRDEWRHRPTVIGLSLALGPALGTAWLFALGTWGRFLAERAITGTILLALVGFTLAWLRRHSKRREPRVRPEAWTGVERALLVMMALGFIVHIWITMFWPFAQYDTLWTFGYNSRVFVLFEEIPNWIDYYPQLVPLTYTYGQLLNGDINDHVARAAVPWFMMSSIMMAYLLGSRVWGKRSIGILTAALWMMVPSALFWSGAGDLEHTVAAYFTGAVLFFVLAWRSHHWRYALISGLLFGAALWTKPTAGSFALGVMLVIGLMGLRESFGLALPSADRRALFRQKFSIAAITGLASIPLGAMWYIRNIAMGHTAIVFPDSYWNDMAQRSGQEFGWLILIFLLGTAAAAHALWPQIMAGDRPARRRFALMMTGLTLFLLGTLPNALVLSHEWTSDSLWDWVFGARPQDDGLNPLHWLLVIAGSGLLVWQIFPLWKNLPKQVRSSAILTALLATPFTIVWFYGYSYHYRLVLTVTPVFAAMVAALIDGWLLPVMSKNRLRYRTAVFLSVWLCFPALLIASYITFEYTFITPLRTDEEKYAVANPALMEAVAAIEFANEQRPGRDYVNVFSMGEQRLKFFFPDMLTIWDDYLPTELNEIRPDLDVIIGGSRAEFLWEHTAIYPNEVSAAMQMGFAYTRPFLEYRNGNIMRSYLTPISAADDGNNRIIAYNVYAPYRQYSLEEIGPPVTFEGDQWADIALRGLDLRAVIPNDSAPLPQDEQGRLLLSPGETIYLQLYWQRTSEAPPPAEYHVFVHMIDPATGEILAQRDGPPVEDLLPFSLMPYPDLTADRRLWQLPDDLPSGPVNLYIGLYEEVPPHYPRQTVINGPFAGEDGIILRGQILITHP
jgi:hypothetical protein